VASKSSSPSCVDRRVWGQEWHSDIVKQETIA
jgi:hypothetical protein